MDNKVQIIERVDNQLFEVEDKSSEIMVAIRRLKSLMYFLNEFFEYEALDPDSPNENIRTHSYCMLKHYRDYQSVFEIAYHSLCNLDTSATEFDGMLSDLFAQNSLGAS